MFAFVSGALIYVQMKKICNDYYTYLPQNGTFKHTHTYKKTALRVSRMMNKQLFLRNSLIYIEQILVRHPTEEIYVVIGITIKICNGQNINKKTIPCATHKRFTSHQ
jgi:hypothetical protein